MHPSHHAPYGPVYYDAKQPTFFALLPWLNPNLISIFLKGEFWCYMFIHGLIVGLLIYDWITMMPVDWKAAGAFQYFTTFFLTFYNANCFSRYESLYKNSTAVLDAIALFVRELTISFKDEETWKHRLQSAKYLLASADLFFFSVTGHPLTLMEWEEVVKKGLLTKSEATMLMKYPGPEVVQILTTWSMLVVGDALEKDCYHVREKVQKIAHMHNRLDALQMKMMRHYRNISETMAFPIPFAYWHLMNLVFALNFLLLALQLAAFEHWWTVIPYSMALMTFMGLREVSNQLADPFGDDIVDFPLAKYLDHVFDHSICLVQAFSVVEAYDRTRTQIYSTRPFDEEQMRHTVSSDAVMKSDYESHVHSVFIWDKHSPLQDVGGGSGVASGSVVEGQLKRSLAKYESDEGGDSPELDAEWQRLRNQELLGTLITLEGKIKKYESEKDKEADDSARTAGDTKEKTKDSVPDASVAPLQRPERGGRRGGPSKGYQWGTSGDDAASDASRRRRKPHKITGDGEGSDRSFRLTDVKFTSFQDAQLQIRISLQDEPGPRKPPSEPGSLRSNGSRSRSKSGKSRSPARNETSLEAVPESSRV